MSDLADMLGGSTTDPDLEETEPAGFESSEGEEVADQAGEDSGADADEPDESVEAEEGDETPEADEEPTEGDSDSDESGETEPGAEAESELDRLKAELQQARAREEKLLTLWGQRQQEPPPAATGGDLSQLRDVSAAIKSLWTAEPGKEKEALARFSPAVQEAATRGQQRFADMQALLAADPATWVQHVVFPALQPLLRESLAPIQRDREDVALREFAARHSDLSSSKEHWAEVANLVVNEGVPPDRAAELVRYSIERKKVNKTKAQVDQAARQQRALSQSRKAQGTRKPNVAGGRVKPDYRGASSLSDFIRAEKESKRLDQ